MLEPVARLQVVFLDNQHRPAIPTESRAIAAIPRDVALYLLLPPVVEVVLQIVASPAAVPKAAVHEHNASTSDEYEVGIPRKLPTG